MALPAVPGTVHLLPPLSHPPLTPAVQAYINRKSKSSTLPRLAHLRKNYGSFGSHGPPLTGNALSAVLKTVAGLTQEQRAAFPADTDFAIRQTRGKAARDGHVLGSKRERLKSRTQHIAFGIAVSLLAAAKKGPPAQGPTSVAHLYHK